MNRVTVFLTVCYLSSPVTASELHLDEVLRTVRERFLPLRASADDRDIAVAEEAASEGAFDPVLRARVGAIPYGYYQQLRLEAWVEQPTPFWGLTATAGYRLGLGKFAVYDGKLVTNAGGEIYGRLDLPLLRNGQTDARRTAIRRTRLGRKSAIVMYRREELTHLHAAAVRWVDWVASGQRLATQAALLEVVRARDVAWRRRVTVGDLPAIDAVETGRAVVVRQTAVVVAARVLQQASLELGLYLGDRQATPAQNRLPAQLSLPTMNVLGAEESIVLALARRPEPERLRLAQQQSELDLALHKNQRLPALNLYGGVSYDVGRAPADPELGRSLQGPVVEAGLFLDIPIPNRAARSRVVAAEAALRKTGRQLDFSRERVTVDVADALSALAAARERLVLASLEEKLTRELELGERKKLDAGESTLFLVNLREQSTAEAAVRVIDATADTYKAWLGYLAAIGQTVTDPPP